MRPLEKSNLKNTINSIDTYINGASLQLENKIFVSDSKMFLPIEEILRLLELEYSVDAESVYCGKNGRFAINRSSINDNEDYLPFIVRKIGEVLYVEASFFIERLGITLAWENDTHTLYICTCVHYDGYRILPDRAFDINSDNDNMHGFFMYLDGEIISQDENLLIAKNENGTIVLQCRQKMSLEMNRVYRLCFAFNKNRIDGKLSGRLMEVTAPDDEYRFGYMIYTKQSYEEFENFKPVTAELERSESYLEFDHTKLVNMFVQYPDILMDRKRLSAVLGDLFPANRRNINLFLLAFDAGIVKEIKENELDDILVYRFMNTLTEDYGIQPAYAVETICLWCMTYGNRILNKPFIAKRKYSKDIQIELQNRETIWRNSRMTHIRSLGELEYFEPIEWVKLEAEPPYEGTYYYPYEERLGMIWVTKKNNISYASGNRFSYNGIICGLCNDNLDNLISENDINVAGISGKKVNTKTVIGGAEWEYNAYILPTEDVVYMIMFGEKYGISPTMSRYEVEFLREIRNKNAKLDYLKTPVILNEEEFEERLNAGENLDGVQVSFEVKKVCPQINAVLGGYNLWGGEHLNFISKKPMNVLEGQRFTVKVLYVTKTLGSSWVVHYEPLDADDDYKNTEWAECNADDIAEIIRKCL